jgi:hypothetical protein
VSTLGLIKERQEQLFETATMVASRCVFGATVLALPDDLTHDEWAALGVHLHTAMNSTAWWVGDWLLYGHLRFDTDEGGEIRSAGAATSRQYLAALGFEHEEIVRPRRVASVFPPGTRHERLSWSHHLEVAALDGADAHHLLNEAEENGWSTRELREHVRRHQAIDVQEALPGLAKPLRLSVKFRAPVGDRDLLERAAERFNAVLVELGLDGEVKLT